MALKVRQLTWVFQSTLHSRGLGSAEGVQGSLRTVCTDLVGYIQGIFSGLHMRRTSYSGSLLAGELLNLAISQEAHICKAGKKALHKLAKSGKASGLQCALAQGYRLVCLPGGLESWGT